MKYDRYLHDEIEDTPQVPVKRKRPSESQTPVGKTARKVSKKNSNIETLEKQTNLCLFRPTKLTHLKAVSICFNQKSHLPKNNV